jgi:hypothetical protein
MLIKELRIGLFEALAGIAAVGLLLKEFCRRRTPAGLEVPVVPADDVAAQEESAGAEAAPT